MTLAAFAGVPLLRAFAVLGSVPGSAAIGVRSNWHVVHRRQLTSSAWPAAAAVNGE